ncbi:hypothetical protein ABW20_dc0104834 [Dactylellina cionopaga]|nr:hypothetical protein ABW20_dc0104834 [Dactylellina cionopaga]
MSNSLQVWVEPKGHSVEGHTAQCTLTFNGRVIFGPRHCHNNTIRLRDALAAADPRFQLTVSSRGKSIEGHTYSISVKAGGHLYLDRLSTHGHMKELCQAIKDTLAAECVAEAERAAKQERETERKRAAERERLERERAERERLEMERILRELERERAERQRLERERARPSEPSTPQPGPGHTPPGPRLVPTPPLSPPLSPKSPTGPPRGRQDFEIAIICALKVEVDAVEAFLDEDFEADYGFSYGKVDGDFNAYTAGRIGQKAVVLAYMPNMGKVSSATVAAQLRMSFTNIRVAFLVGICGAAPKSTADKDIFLGDIIVSTAVVQTDFGRQHPDVFIRKDTLEDNLGRADREIRSFLQKLEGKRITRRLEDKTFNYVANLGTRDRDYIYPSGNNDNLYSSEYRHKHRNGHPCQICTNCKNPNDPVCEGARTASCTELGCDSTSVVPREREGVVRPSLHFGRFASADTVMKSGFHRDNIIKKEGVIAFEMEGAGSWDSLATVIIKSACDYADSHKNKAWQNYASATAAACAKAILDEWRSSISV